MRDQMTQRERNRLAKQIHTARYFDRYHYAVNRPYGEYVWRANGLEQFLDYVESLPGAHLLDIGAGTTRAAGELASLRPQLNIEATILSMPGSWDMRSTLLASDRGAVHFTPAERLHGVCHGIGGIIAVISTTYSELPEAAVQSMDNVLCPGGAIKMVCLNYAPTAERKFRGGSLLASAAIAILTKDIGRFINSMMHTPSIHGVTTAEEYAQLFRQRGYDIFTGPSEAEDIHSVLLAIKPGQSSNATSAQQLYQADLSTVEAQLDALGA